jgi:uncharacterized membrane protein YfcA
LMWTTGVWAAIVLSAGIGLSLGLVGGGGSIVTVPILVYVAGLAPRAAIALSLPIVGATAALGAIFQARRGNVHPKAAAIYGATGMAGAVSGARLTALVPPPVLMVLFAGLMIVVGLRMVQGRDEPEMPHKVECNWKKCAVAGLGLGIMTGFLGVGGGFLLVPALLRFTHMPMRQAVGTSLAIIAANSAAGFLAHMAQLQGQLPLALSFTCAAVIGLMVGTLLSRRIKPACLKTAFGGLSLAVAAYLIAMNVQPLIKLIGR